jgi:hypothetical protein
MGDWTLWAYGESGLVLLLAITYAKPTGCMFACCTLPAYMLAYFISIILKGMGYSTTESLLLVRSHFL